MPSLSTHFLSREPSDIRLAQIRFAKRTDGVDAINVAIGNVSLPMHPAMRKRLQSAGSPHGAFADGVVKYTPTVGTTEAREAFTNVLRASGIDTAKLHVQVTNGGSQAMELVIAGCCGPAGSSERPLLLVDAAYTNYKAFAERLGRATVSIARSLERDGRFALPSIEEIETIIERRRPGALVVIPYDNPTGQLYAQETLVELARLAVRHDLWLVSDEAYRELHYTGVRPPSVWSIDDSDVPGILGRRIGIETASKVWNACGLRIGALVTDSRELHEKAVAENTASLCPGAIGQHIFGALSAVSVRKLGAWFDTQRAYYRDMLGAFTDETRRLLPGAIVSRPDAAIYSVVDFRDIAPEGFDAREFVLSCAEEGRIEMDGRALTLLTAPMAGFYSPASGAPNPGRTQVRIAYVEPPERMALVPRLLAGLFDRFSGT